MVDPIPDASEHQLIVVFPANLYTFFNIALSYLNKNDLLRMKRSVLSRFSGRTVNESI
jgi:hypothetical protein